MKLNLSSPGKLPTLQLHKIVRVLGKHDTHVFTFVVPSQLTRGFLQSVQSKEFSYGGLSWYVKLEYYSDPLDAQARRGSFVVHYQKQPLGFALHCCGLSNMMKAHLNYIRFTILHQEHFMRNLTREEIEPNFTSVKPSFKVPRWIEAGYLTKERYVFDDSSCLLEVELRGAVTTYEEQLRVPRDPREVSRCKTLESTSFNFAGADWSLVLDWKSIPERTGNSDRDCRPSFFIQRHSRAKNWTRVQYKTTITWHETGTTKSTMIDQLIPPEIGATTAPVPIGDRRWFASSGGPVVTAKHKISLGVELYKALQISRVDLIPTAPQGGKNCSRVTDSDGFDWVVMSDILGSFVKLRIFPDPENLVSQRKDDTEGMVVNRSTAFAIQLIPYDPALDIVKSLTNFYTINVPLISKSTTDNRLSVSDISQDVVLMLEVDKVCSTEFGYSRPSDNSITLRIEWLHVCQLNRTEHRAYDELIGLQHYQLSQEFNSQMLSLKHTAKVIPIHTSRKSVTQSGETSPVHRTGVQLNENFGQRHSSKTLGISFSSPTHQDRIRSPSRVQPGNYIHQTAQTTSTANPVKISTPPVFINGSPQSADMREHTDMLQIGATWRRHSSCLEDVGSNGQRTRRRLPSPPSSASLRTSDAHLSVKMETHGSISGNPRLTYRNSIGHFNP
ncbi:hypothetical protein CSKR_108848 [Clonorchis sinensis]|uniref:MATH domain-containing protein n=1 Tax=Clonorchis sinensis TaxID=79923 RepID=A0A3R7GWG3_CLOSI|nr:hypothetical protein CSKR_108848 [Clonorchis sinensis]